MELQQRLVDKKLALPITAVKRPLRELSIFRVQ